MRANASLLLLAAVFPTWTAADARKEPAINIHTPLFARTNHTTKSISSMPPSDVSTPHSLEHASASIATQSPSFARPTTFDTLVSTYPHPSLASPPPPLRTGSSNVTRSGNMTWGAPSSPPKPTTTPAHNPKLSGSMCQGYINGTICIGHSKPKPTDPHTTLPSCIPSTMAVEFVIQYPSTVTLYGNSSDYTPPYPPLVLPTRCDNHDSHPSFGEYGSGQPPEATNSVLVVTSEGKTHTTTMRMSAAVGHATGTTTFLTSDKNPATVQETDPPPNFSQPWDKGGPNPPKSTDSSGAQPGGPDPNMQSSKYVITAGPTRVTINKSTYTVPPGQSTTVTVDGSGFTINPSAVIGAGETISRPQAVSMSTELGGVPVTYSNGNVVIDGHTFTKPTSPTTATVDGKYVSISPDGIAVDGQTMKFATATDSIVTGGELLTAIGRSIVVVHSTTFTYGPGVAERITAINGDTVSIEPTGIVLHGSTIGGPSANPTDTTYEIVGGATIAKIPPSMVVINGVTYAVGPGTGKSTIDAGNEKITLGPEGIVMASMTMSVPFDASVVTTISTTGHSPLETVTEGESGATTGVPNARLGMICICIAIGVMVLG